VANLCLERGLDLQVNAIMVVFDDLVVELVNEVGIGGVFKGKKRGVVEAVSLHPEGLEFLLVGAIGKGDLQLFENLQFILIVEVKGFLQVHKGISIRG
jgi:hypothetical protein